jgi:hypothetical protein
MCGMWPLSSYSPIKWCVTSCGLVVKPEVADAPLSFDGEAGGYSLLPGVTSQDGLRPRSPTPAISRLWDTISVATDVGRDDPWGCCYLLGGHGHGMGSVFLFSGAKGNPRFVNQTWWRWRHGVVIFLKTSSQLSRKGPDVLEIWWSGDGRRWVLECW